MNPDQKIGLLAAGSAFLLALVLVPALRWIAIKGRIIDRPGGRKTQREPVPLLGGVAVTFAAVLSALLICGVGPGRGEVSFVGYGPVLIAGFLTFSIGLVDDVFKDRIGPLPKFIGQFLSIAILFGGRYERLFSGEATAGEFAYLFAISLWFLTVLNAVNFVDNMNGLCGGLSSISLLVALFGLGGSGGPEGSRAALVAGALGGALVGFLPWNFPRARIYLGDAGSHLTGFLLATLSLEFTTGFMSGGSHFFGVDAFVPAMLLLGLPLFDLLFSVVRRWRERRPLFHGDARHLSHRLVGAGLDQTSAVLLLWGVHLMLAAMALVSLPLSAGPRFALTAAVLVFLGLLSWALIRVEQRRKST